jgi:hypothetical protein
MHRHTLTTDTTRRPARAARDPARQVVIMRRPGKELLVTSGSRVSLDRQRTSVLLRGIGCGADGSRGVDSTPTKLDGTESHEFEQEDLDAAARASDAVEDYCADAVSEAQRLGCESHVTDAEVPDIYNEAAPRAAFPADIAVRAQGKQFGAPGVPCTAGSQPLHGAMTPPDPPMRKQQAGPPTLGGPALPHPFSLRARHRSRSAGRRRPARVRAPRPAQPDRPP